jgi:hypothetical protein
VRSVNYGQVGRWEGSQIRAAAALQLGEEHGALADQALDIDRHAAGPVGLQLFQALAKFGDGSMPVAVAPVIEGDADLEDALVEIPDRVRLGDPDCLEGLVLLEELLPVELVDAVQ